MRKFYAGEGLTVGFLLILGIFAVITVTSLQSKMDRLVKTEARNIELAGEINQAVTMICRTRSAASCWAP